MGQLDFGDFISSANLTQGQVTAGNPDLKPDQRWQYELAYEYHFWDQGALTVSLTHQDIENILTSCSDNGTRFEIECYDIGHLYTAAHFVDRKLLKPPFLIQSVFGIRGGIGTHPEDVAMMKRTADRLFGDDYIWSVLAAGRKQTPLATMAATMGGNVRVGLEDSLWDGPGELARSNADQVRRIRRILEDLSLRIATPDEARETLQLKGRDNVAF